MYRTPPRNIMVNTRSTVKKNEEQEKEGTGTDEKVTPIVHLPPKVISKSTDEIKSDVKQLEDNMKVFDQKLVENVDTYTPNRGVHLHVPGPSGLRNLQDTAKSSSNSRSKSSSSSGKSALRARLELEAAEAKARIQMELIDKKLAADLAELNDEIYSSHSEEQEDHTKSIVEEWLQRNQQDRITQHVQHDGTYNKDKLCPPPQDKPSGSTDGTVQLLASALKDLAAASATGGTNANMLSRLCTPRDLPTFSGNPMEWLHFRQAYDESTLVCHFTEKENLWRLRKCLHGPAKEAVTALLISATSPDIVMSTLELQFGNPEIIISQIMQDIKKLPTMSQDYHKEIIMFSVKVKNFVAAVQAIGQDEYLKGMSIVSVILNKLPAVLISKWADYSFLIINGGVKSKLVILSEFLNEEAVKISKTAVYMTSQYESSMKRKQSDQNRSHNILFMQNKLNNNEEKCRFCRDSKHNLPDCKRFKKVLRKDRWYFVKRNGICFKCLVSRHNRETCPAPVCDKNKCGQSHHQLLHYETNDNNNQQQQSDDPKSESGPKKEIVTHVHNNCKVLLKTIPINIHGPSGVISVIALLDDGSTVSLISAAVAMQVGLRGHKQTMRVCGAWSSNDLVCDSEIVDLSVSNKDGALFTIKARSVNELNLPVQNSSSVNLANYELSNKIKDSLCYEQYKPQILIGQDNYDLLLPLQIIKGKPNEPYVTRTPLGWCIHGRVHSPPPPDDRVPHSTLFVTEVDDVILKTSESERMLQDIHEEVRRSFTIESMGITCHPRQNSEDVRAWDHLERTSELINGRWYVGLPWKDINCKMPNSYPNALTRLRGVERKMKVNDGYASRYEDRFNHLFQNDYAKELTNPKTATKTWYLPHFGVDNPNKKKLRLVFDAAAKSEGMCLNDYLLKGPDLLMSLYGIMLRFRENRIAVTGDIRDMFLRIKIIPKDQDALRFLWKNIPEGSTIPEGDVKTFVMTSLIFGANCSPFIAQFIKNKNALPYESSMPAAVQAICKQHYMDDYIDSIEDEKTAVELVKQITYIHEQGGFNIRNWTSNSETVIKSIPKDSLGSTAVKFKIGHQNEGERTLGLIWFPEEDMLGFDVSFKRIPEAIINGQQRPTKREVLRVVMSIFDVYGFLSPFTIKGKIMLQETWRAALNWDDSIPDRIYEQWTGWLELLNNINRIRLPRHYKASTSVSETGNAPSALDSNAADRTPASAPPAPAHPPSSIHNNKSLENCASYMNLQLHIFCDASTKAICAVAYWCWINENKCKQVAFISSKCRVAPVKHTSVPRLELQAAVLGARLAETIKKEHKMIAQKTYFWCDSTTVLHWIKNTARNYKAYVAHRLGEIDELTQINEWRYIPTKLNVADIATRENCDLSVFENEWFHGPGFLYNSEDFWPLDKPIAAVSDEDLECVTMVQTLTECLPAVPEPERFSSWLRLLKTTCMVLSFVDKCKKRTGNVDSDVMERAERLLIKYSQAQSFAEDLQNLKNKKVLDKKSRLLTLSPFLDDHGILRVGGRIDAAAEISSETKRPVILEGRNHVAMLIVRHYHIKAAHGNQETVVNNLKQKYWLTRIRPAVKHVAIKCMFCRIKKAKPQPPRMGDLPAARMAHHHRVFSYCGLDLFGPMEVTVGRRREKRYGVIFTCLTVRAVHIEIVTRLTSDALIMALRRMAARRGWPLHLYSDNGTNMRGADTELKKSIQELNQDVLKSEAVNYGTTWNFIPPASPHWGGAWERLIRTIKSALKVTLNERAPRDEVLSTLMTEVEQMVNSRPLTHVTVEPKSDETLTPNHFLIGSSSNLPVIGVFDNSDLYLRKQWRTSQALADAYWRRWIREVLPDMLPRRKWQQEHRPLQVGDLVLIVDPDSPRNIWPKGRVQAVLPGKDGRVRLVDVKTKSGVLRRSAARVAFIPTRDEC